VRPSWQDYFLTLAFIASQRSHDTQTKHGCILVKDKKVLGTGYNGFPRGMDDNSLPNTRPDKYPWMVHSEVNAVNNCILKPEGATAYVTGEPCLNCLIHLWQNNVTSVCYVDKHGSVLIDNIVRKNTEIFLQQTNMKIYKVNFDISWIKQLLPED